MGWLAEISADLLEAVAHYRRVRDDELYAYKSTVYFTLALLHIFAAIFRLR